MVMVLACLFVPLNALYTADELERSLVLNSKGSLEDGATYEEDLEFAESLGFPGFGSKKKPETLADLTSFSKCIEKLKMGYPWKPEDEGNFFATCSSAGKVIGALLRGIEDAGFLESQQISSDGTVVTATLNVDQLYGEFPSKSKVPVMWKVDKTLKFTLAVEDGAELVDVEGLGTAPPAEGLRLYSQIDKKDRCKLEDLEEIRTSLTEGKFEFAKMPKCIVSEMTASAELLKRINAKKEWTGKKIGNIFNSIDYLNSKAIGAAGKWGNVFYPMITATPLKVTKFVFAYSGSPKYTPGFMAVTKEAPWPEATEVLEEEEITALRLKVVAAGPPALIADMKTLSVAEAIAASGMAFAEMVAFGMVDGTLLDYTTDDAARNLKETLDTGIGHMASVKNVMNMFTRCPKDNEPCQGKVVGRVTWKAEVQEEMK